jgi:hypothetical protein
MSETAEPHEFIVSGGLFAEPPRCACGADVGDAIHDVPEGNPPESLSADPEP